MSRATYNMNNDTMVYGTVSSSFKSGGVNPLSLTDALIDPAQGEVSQILDSNLSSWTLSSWVLRPPSWMVRRSSTGLLLL